jgi:hypothetical protein
MWDIPLTLGFPTVEYRVLVRLPLSGLVPSQALRVPG